jgi:transcription elongation factor Elf1
MIKEKLEKLTVSCRECGCNYQYRSDEGVHNVYHFFQLEWYCGLPCIKCGDEESVDADS